MAQRPVIKATTEEISRSERLIDPEFSEVNSKSFFAPVPSKIGIESRKLKRTASSLESPESSPPEIVAPEREIPGIKARL